MGIPKKTVTAGAAITDQNGQYSLAGVSSGTYTLRFTKTGYVTLEVEALAVTQEKMGAVDSENLRYGSAPIREAMTERAERATAPPDSPCPQCKKG